MQHYGGRCDSAGHLPWIYESCPGITKKDETVNSYTSTYGYFTVHLTLFIILTLFNLRSCDEAKCLQFAANV